MRIVVINICKPPRMLGSNTPSLDESVISTEVAATSSSKRKRGAGILWKFVDYHQDIEMALRRFDQCNEPEETRVLGRVNEGKNTAYYYYCPKKSAGCTKQWRICTLNDSENVVEEESPCEHSCHELYRRNGGRGLSFDHLDMIKEAMDSGLTRTKGILDFFDKKRRSLMIAGS